MSVMLHKTLVKFIQFLTVGPYPSLHAIYHIFSKVEIGGVTFASKGTHDPERWPRAHITSGVAVEDRIKLQYLFGVKGSCSTLSPRDEELSINWNEDRGCT